MIEPFLKWPGGKRWLVTRYPGLFPSRYGRYCEPFLGGGAVFFSLKPHDAILSDTNADLINAYACLKKSADKIDRSLSRLQKKHSKRVYYVVRKQQPSDPIRRAVRFIYLNRTCFNGIYRVNLKGKFNVPIGTKRLVEYPPEYLRTIANTLANASIRVADFENTIDSASSGDFLFIDPPYTVMHNNNNFLKYNANLFSWDDQKRLAAAVRRADRRGALIMISNADHRSIHDLYSTFGNHFKVNRSSVLAADPVRRRDTTELVITNYKIQPAENILRTR